MNDRDRDAAGDWMRERMPSEDEFSLEDNDERGCEQRYYFLRGRDSAMCRLPDPGQGWSGGVREAGGIHR